MTLLTAAGAALPVPVRRLGYRAAYAALRVYWLVFRPSVTGVKCALTDRDQVLLVRHSYGSRAWDLPGGSIKAGESPENAARREIEEELGVTADYWNPLGQLRIVIDHRRDTIHCFQAEVHEPNLTIDHGELLTAQWFPFGDLPSVGRYTRQILSLTEHRPGVA